MLKANSLGKLQIMSPCLQRNEPGRSESVLNSSIELPYPTQTSL